MSSSGELVSVGLTASPPALLSRSHFHLDHCGALPYFSEMCGYEGPIYMTHPTKAICPILLVSLGKGRGGIGGEMVRVLFPSGGLSKNHS